MFKEEYGNLVTGNYPIICQQVNCKGVMGAGIALQVIASRMAYKTQTKKNHKINRLIMIPIILFAIMLLMLLCFWKNSVLLIAIDIALLFSSIELLFYLKRRNSV